MNTDVGKVGAHGGFHFGLYFLGQGPAAAPALEVYLKGFHARWQLRLENAGFGLDSPHPVDGAGRECSLNGNCRTAHNERRRMVYHLGLRDRKSTRLNSS